MKVAPSILSADFAHLADSFEMIKQGGAEYAHLDVMDGHFVPNMSFAAVVIKGIRPYSDLVFDTHLMISEPLKYIKDFVDCGSDIITVHYEACDAEQCLKEIRKAGVKAGLSIKPATKPEEIFHLLPLCDLVLVMSVEPGFGGQKFMPDSLAKVRTLKEKITAENLVIEIEIDGGIGLDNIEEVAAAGVDVVVAGSSVFGAPDPKEIIKRLKGK